jgi:phage-related protein
MYHSLNIFVDDSSGKFINTWEDWGLIPTSRPTFSMPKKKKRTIEIPGMDGTFNVSKALGELFYENREGSFEFIVDDPYNYDSPSEFERRQWQNLYSEIANAIHGKAVRIILEDDPRYYYIGEMTVNEWKSDPAYSVVVLDYEVDPYKYSLSSSTEI